MSVDAEWYIERIRCAIRGLFEQTPFDVLLDDPASLLDAPGKMLRARLLIRVGGCRGIEEEVIVRGGAAVELVHAATLLHDDVIDNALLRRNEPAFWTRHGASAAILLGDLLMYYAVRLLQPLGRAEFGEALLQLAGEVGEAEVLQEVVHRGRPRTWRECAETARHKTGPFFAFAGLVAGGDDEVLVSELTECGYLVGTAYQLADDLYDAYGVEEQADKSLARDGARGKETVARLLDRGDFDPVGYVHELLGEARGRLIAYPDVQEAWGVYLREDMMPALDHLMARAVQITSRQGVCEGV